jgi:hypothetical protein
MLGSSMEYREMWRSLDGATPFRESTSDLNGGVMYMDLAGRLRDGKKLTLYGRLYSDVLTSSRQYLPPGIDLGIHLRKSPDAFAVKSTDPSGKYRLVIESASIYLKRMSISPSRLPGTNIKAIKSNASIVFNRLECRMKTLPAGQSGWQWLDCLNSGPLPNRLYVAFTKQQAVYGSHTTASTYFEPANLTSFNVKLNGRDVMVEPLHSLYIVNSETVEGELERKVDDVHMSDAKAPYLALLETCGVALDSFEPTRLSIVEYIRGNSVLCLELSKCGAKIGSTGTLDLEFAFGEGGNPFDACAFLFTERTQLVELS